MGPDRARDFPPLPQVLGLRPWFLSKLWEGGDPLSSPQPPSLGLGTSESRLQSLTLRLLLLVERDSQEHEDPTTSEMAEETYSPKIFRPKHTRISELKAEAVKKDRRKKLTQSKFVGGAENTAHPRVNSAPEMRQESEQVSLGDAPPPPSASAPCSPVTTPTAELSLRLSARWGSPIAHCMRHWPPKCALAAAGGA